MSLASVEKESAVHDPTPRTPFSFCLLGELTIATTDGRVPSPPHRTHGLLVILLLYPQPLRRERLIGQLFPNVPESKGRQRLSNLLWLLRRALPNLPLETSPQEIHVPLETRWLDVEAFRQATQGDDLQSWLVALSLYRDDLLPGIYDDWLLQEREMLYLQYVSLTHRACDELLRQGRFGEALPFAERLVQRESFDEHALRTLMRIYRALGRRGAALAAYERFVTLAADELDVDPEPATQALAEALRSAAPRAMNETVADRDTQVDTGQDDPEALLRLAQDALARADRSLVEECLQQMRAHPACCERDARSLEVDLALLFEEYDRARRLLETHPAQEIREQVQKAQLALGQRDLAQAQAIASEVLMLAREAGEQELELWALLTLGQAQQQTGHGAQGEALGRALAQLERDIYDEWSYYDWYRFWVVEYNYYGDPKYRASDPTPVRLAAPAVVAVPTTTLQVEVPDYVLTTTVDGFDLVTIPGGKMILEGGLHEIPYWEVSVDYPAGYRVQDVELTLRAGRVLTTGLILPTEVMTYYTPVEASSGPTETLPFTEDDDWFPVQDEAYGWHVTQNPDGSSVLTIQIFPFHYQPATTNAEWCDDFTFDIDVTSTSVASARSNSTAAPSCRVTRSWQIWSWTTALIPWTWSSPPRCAT